MSNQHQENGTSSPSDKDWALSQYDGPDKVISSFEMSKILEAQGHRVKKFQTGIMGLDAAVDGIQTGELIAIGGPRKNGKTLVAQTITCELIKQGVDVLWLSYEVGMEQFISSMPEGVKFYIPKKLQASDLDWLELRVREGKIKYQTRVVFIDNLHFLLDLAKARNVSLDIGQIIRKLKRMAIEHDLVMFILCHSRKMEMDKDGKPKEISDWDMRDSSFIPQESDTTWMVQRYVDDNGRQLAMLKVCCHRRTGVIDSRITLIKSGKLLIEWFDGTESKGVKCQEDQSNISLSASERNDSIETETLAF